MGILDSIFAGAKAFVRELVSVAAEAVKVVLEEIDRSSFGRAATDLVRAATRTYFRSATDLAEEERELAEKYQRDGRRSDADEERLGEIRREREELKKEIDSAKGAAAANELKAKSDKIVVGDISDDEASGNIGVIASKACPACGFTMRMRQGPYNRTKDRRSFFWQCTSAQSKCPTISFDPLKTESSVVRGEDPNFDLPQPQRRGIWEKKDVLVETAGRIRASLGEADDDVVCPTHVLPMRLLRKRPPRAVLTAPS